MATNDLAVEAPRERGNALPVAAALLTVTLWASAFVGIRSAGRHLSPGALSLGRLLVTLTALGFVVLLRREPLPSRRDLPLLALVGALWFGLYNLALNAAERLVDAGTASMLVNTGPILIAVLAGLTLKEGFPRTLLAGCAVAFGGAVLIGAATAKHGFNPGWGAALCVAAAALYSVAVVVQKPLLARVSPLMVTWVACSAGTLVCLPFAGQLWRQAAEAPASSLGWVVYLGIAPSAIGFVAWAFALSRTSAGRMGATTYLVPPIAIVLGWLLLGEVPPGLALAGGALCLTGVVLARR